MPIQILYKFSPLPALSTDPGHSGSQDGRQVRVWAGRNEMHERSEQAREQEEAELKKVEWFLLKVPPVH